jgi:hypothetical protein
MLGRKTFTQDEIDHAKAVVDDQLAAYGALVEAAESATSDPAVTSALDAFEPLFFNNLLLALDRPFVHRVRMVTGKDGNPLNEVELVADSLMNNGGVLRGNNVIKLVPADSVLQLEIGDAIGLRAQQFERLARAFFAELEAKFL